jgi:hypothetical protein
LTACKAKEDNLDVENLFVWETDDVVSTTERKADIGVATMVKISARYNNWAWSGVGVEDDENDDGSNMFWKTDSFVF